MNSDLRPKLLDKLGLTQQGIGRLNDHASRQAIKRASQAKTGSRWAPENGGKWTKAGAEHMENQSRKWKYSVRKNTHWPAEDHRVTESDSVFMWHLRELYVKNKNILQSALVASVFISSLSYLGNSNFPFFSSSSFFWLLHMYSLFIWLLGTMEIPVHFLPRLSDLREELTVKWTF